MRRGRRCTAPTRRRPALSRSSGGLGAARGRTASGASSGCLRSRRPQPGAPVVSRHRPVETVKVHRPSRWTPRWRPARRLSRTAPRCGGALGCRGSLTIDGDGCLTLSPAVAFGLSCCRVPAACLGLGLLLVAALDHGVGPGLPSGPAGPLWAPAAPTLASSMMTPFADLAAAAGRGGPPAHGLPGGPKSAQNGDAGPHCDGPAGVRGPRRPAFLGGGRDRRHSLPGARGRAFGRPGDHAPHVGRGEEAVGYPHRSPGARGRAGPVGSAPWRGGAGPSRRQAT